MSSLKFEISMSLDGFVAGPDASMELPLGEGGERLHEWVYGLKAWREPHGMEGGEANVDSEILAENLEGTGAILMGRRMFSGDGGPWGDDPFEGWWGDDPPFRMPVFVLTHHPREPLTKGDTTFTFVTDGIESALEQARAAAGGKDVAIGGGASVAQQYIRSGLLDEMQIHLVPLLLGDGVRLFENHLGGDQPALEPTRVVESPSGVTHLSYRFAR
jgi:dihydrofolate reductase